MVTEAPVVIVGGGISGLATAYFLSKAGIRSIIIEKTSRLGGLIGTDRIEGCVLEAGPDSYLAAKPAVTDVARELGDLSSAIVGSNDTERRVYIARRGQLVPLPRGMAMMVPGEWRAAFGSKLFSTKTKLQFAREIFSSPQHRAEDVSVRNFIASHFGEELVDYVAEPLLAGVYGGAAETLSAASVLPRFVGYEREYGSLIRGVRRERRASPAGGSMFLSFRDGMEQLPDALAQAIAPFSRIVFANADKIEQRQNGWRIQAADERFEAQELVLACPAHASAQLLQPLSAELAAELAAIPYSSAILVTLVFRDSDIHDPLRGFGFLIPRAERTTIAAATWIHRKFPSRLPPGLAALRAFIVDPEAGGLMAESHDFLIQLVRSDFERFLGIDAEPVFSRLYSWPASMPQYTVGHEVRRKKIMALAENIRGFSLVGNAFEGVGIPDCVRLAKAAAAQIEGRFHSCSETRG